MTTWWNRDTYAARRPRLLARQAALAAVRRFFAERDFVEVETPALQISPGLEIHLKAFATRLEEPFGGEPRGFFLHTSPEFAMKKLLAAGEPRLFQLARVFRNAERAPLHHPEFTMLEWYRAEAPWTALMDDSEALIRAVMRAVPRELSRSQLRYGERHCDPTLPFERLSVADAFMRHAGVDLAATLGDTRHLAAEAGRIGIAAQAQDRWDDVFFRIFLDRVEPQLGVGRATILHSYPASMAALSRLQAEDPRWCERFEIHAAGVELANAFGELTDPAEQRRRFEADMAEKRRLYGVAYPIDEDFLAALAQMPAAAGIALGFDRLMLLATGAERIEDVLWAPVAET